jgi:hypothetical protein
VDENQSARGLIEHRLRGHVAAQCHAAALLARTRGVSERATARRLIYEAEVRMSECRILLDMIADREARTG